MFTNAIHGLSHVGDILLSPLLHQKFSMFSIVILALICTANATAQMSSFNEGDRVVRKMVNERFGTIIDVAWKQRVPEFTYVEQGADADGHEVRTTYPAAEAQEVYDIQYDEEKLGDRIEYNVPARYLTLSKDFLMAIVEKRKEKERQEREFENVDDDPTHHCDIDIKCTVM